MLVCTLPLAAQEGEREIVALVPVVPLPPATDGSSAAAGSENPIAQYAPLITESLRIALTNAGFKVETVPQLTEFPQIWPESEAVDALIAVFGTATLAQDRLVIQLSAYQVSTRQIVTGSMANGRVDLALYNVIDSAVADLATKVRRWVVDNPLDKLRGTPQLLRSLSLESPDEGEEIYLPGGERLGVISGGTLTTLRLSVPVGSTLVLEKRKEGYITDRQQVHITKPDEKVRLSALWPVSRFVTDLMWTVGFPIGGAVGFRMFVVPDWIYLSMNYQLSAQVPTFAGGSNVFHFVNYGALGAYLFWGPTSHFRFSVSAGFGAADTIFTTPGTGSALDGFISFLNPTFYANFRRFYGFLRTNFWFVLRSDAGLLDGGVMGDNGPPPITFGVGYKW